MIVYLAQKGNHSSYQRDSYDLLTKSLNLLYEHYFLNEHYDILKVFPRSDAVGGVVRQKWKKYVPIVSENILGRRTAL